MIHRVKRELKISIVFLASALLFLGLNAVQLYSKWAIWTETQRLERLASQSADTFQNPAPLADHFAGKLSPDFWEFSIIDGAGKVSAASAWHEASMTFENGLTIHHFYDPFFDKEDSSIFRKPAAGRYNNVALIGGRGFRPTPSSDIVMKFHARISDGFYGTAGMIFEPAGIIRQNGTFAGPFDMVGFSVIGKASELKGTSGPVCYLALQGMPVQVESLPMDVHIWHSYEVRLRWVSKTKWLAMVKVDDAKLCQISMPAFGPVEVQVWSDNALVSETLPRWWEIAPKMDLKFENGGKKLVQLEDIQISAEGH